MRIKLFSSFCILAALSSGACTGRKEMGVLRVDAPSDGHFEIYRVASESPLQLESEQIGSFNEDVPLEAGSYLVLADCSSEMVVVNPGRTQRLKAYEVAFVPPLEPTAGDKFSVQCTRYDATRSRQYLTNRYKLMVIEGKRDMLVGMLPLRLDSQEQAIQDDNKIAFDLSALQVASSPSDDQAIPYFVSATENIVSVTEAQQFGKWQFLLPGKYMVEVNGTSMAVELGPKESRVIQPARIMVSTPKSLDLDQGASVRGAPTLVEINQGHWLGLNEVYSVLPGPATLRLADSVRRHDVELKEGELLEKNVRAVTVQMDCSPWEWSCLGSRKVQLYEKDQFYAFAEGVTDAPVLFFGDAAWVGVEGSRDVRYQIAKDADVTKLRMGTVKLKPQPQNKPGVMTDLVRVEAAGAPLSGFTLDVSLERETVMPLIVGQYNLASFVSSTAIEGDRRKSGQTFYVSYGKTLELSYPVYLSEKRVASLYGNVQTDLQGVKATREFFSSNAQDLLPKFRIK